MYACACGWRGTWYAYHKSFKGRQLSAGGMRPFFELFPNGYARAPTYQEKMVLIDQLIHRFHGELESWAMRAGGVNLIGGKHRQVIEFLDNLTYADGNTPGLSGVRDEWKKVIEYKRRKRVASNTGPGKRGRLEKKIS